MGRNGFLRSRPVARTVTALALLAILAAPAAAAPKSIWDGKWFTSEGNGSTVELPAFLQDGPIHGLIGDDNDYGDSYDGVEGSSLWAQHYWANSTGRPYVFLTTQFIGSGAHAVTYSVDKDDLGVLSGYEDADSTKVFYAFCRKADAHLQCVELHWDKSENATIAPLMDHILSSLKLTVWKPMKYSDE
jgi:hypothetical protein